MSNALVVIGGFQIPAYVKQYEARNEDFGSAGALPKISVKTDKSGFLLTKGGETMLLPVPLPVVILGVSPRGKAFSRSFYLKGYTPGSTDPPDCSSDGGTFPDGGDSRQSTGCAVCPHSQWGSGPGDGQACSQHKVIFVVPAINIDGAMFQMRVAPTSLKYLGAYGNELTAHGINKSVVITNIGYRDEPTKDYPILSFSVGGFLDQSNGTRAIERSESVEITGLIYTPPIEVQALPAPVVSKAPTLTSPPPPPPPPPLTGAELDSAGHAWNPTIHAATKTKVRNGTWKLKRGVSTEQATAVLGSFPAPATITAPAPPETSQTGSASALDAALAQWG